VSWVALPSFATSLKMGPDFSKKVGLRLKLPQCAPKFFFFNEKKSEKFGDFSHRKFTLKVQF
jgi:hypothetical protein